MEAAVTARTRCRWETFSVCGSPFVVISVPPIPCVRKASDQDRQNGHNQHSTQCHKENCSCPGSVATRMLLRGRYKQTVKVDAKILSSIKLRQTQHFDFVKKIRPTTTNEWFVLYPASMRVAIPNYYSTRRLFKSYEPFLSHESVKIAASVPTLWKLNRRLFNRAMKPFLKPSKWVLHADGRLPYFGFITNMPLQFSIWFYRHLATRLGLIKGNQGPWGDWGNVFSSEQWDSQLQELSQQHQLTFFTGDMLELARSNQLNSSQKTNLMQVLVFINQ